MKTVLVSGASGDIGKAIVKEFHSNGYTVVGTYLNNEDSIKSLKKELGDNFYYYKCDLSDFQQCDLLVKNIHQENLNIDILINNAGI